MKDFIYTIIALPIGIIAGFGFGVARFLYNIPTWLVQAGKSYSSGNKTSGYVTILLSSLLITLFLNGVFYLSAKLKWVLFSEFYFDLPYGLTDFIVCLLATTFSLYFMHQIYIRKEAHND